MPEYSVMVRIAVEADDSQRARRAVIDRLESDPGVEDGVTLYYVTDSEVEESE